MTGDGKRGHVDLVPQIASARGTQRYLEIGCQWDFCFDWVRQVVPDCVGVDPNRGGTLRMTSDEFFAAQEKKGQFEPVFFDLIFIDGDHSHEQSWRDFRNSISSLSRGGLILLHDTNPPAKNWTEKHVCGEVWKTVVAIRQTYRFSLATYPGDYGLTAVYPWIASDDLGLEHSLTFEEFDARRGEILNFKEWDGFLDFCQNTPD